MLKAPKVKVTFNTYDKVESVLVSGHKAKRISKCCRSVFKYKNWVVKVAEGPYTNLSTDPLKQNRREVINYRKSVGKTWGKYLVPVVAWASDYKWLVMPYVASEEERVAHLLRKHLKINDHYGQLVATPKGVVCYDYGL